MDLHPSFLLGLAVVEFDGRTMPPPTPRPEPARTPLLCNCPFNSWLTTVASCHCGVSITDSGSGTTGRRA